MTSYIGVIAHLFLLVATIILVHIFGKVARSVNDSI